MTTEPHSKYTIGCPDCDLLISAPLPTAGYSHHCPRCGKSIIKGANNSIHTSLILTITALILYIPAVFMPLLTMSSMGFEDNGSILDSIVIIWQDGYYFMSFATAMSTVAFPLLLFSSLMSVSLALHLKRRPAWLSKIFRIYTHIEEWSMCEVYLLGIIIALIKMKDMGDIHYHIGFFFFLLVVLVAMKIHSVVNKRVFWEAIKPSRPLPQSQNRPTTAKQQGLLLCHDCHSLEPAQYEGQPCPRCNATLHSRKKNSLNRTSALVLSSFLMLFPANILPIMRVDFLGSVTLSTILDGIIYFFQHDSFFIGLVILIASILVPVYKVVGISILLASIHFKKKNHLKKKTIMFRCIAFIGRWSMLDIFVIALLAALVNFGFFSSVSASHAATFFCGVVVLTMCAAITFDPRLLWDHCQPQPHIPCHEHKP